MIVIYAPTKIDFWIFRFLSSLGLSIYVFDKNNVAHSKSLKRARKIHLIRFDNEDKIGLLNYIDYPSEKIIENYLSSLQLDTAYRRLSRFYERIDNLHQKLDLSLVSTFNYFSSGLVYAFYLSNRVRHNERLTIINCEISSFISHEYKIFDKQSIHLTFPVGQCITLFSTRIKSSLCKFFEKKEKNEGQRSDQSILHNQNINLAILFHKSDEYGRLFKKEHYFSNEENSPLYWDRVAKCAVYPDDKTPSYLLPLKEVCNKTEYLRFFQVVSLLDFLRSSNQKKRALIILFYRYLQYDAWSKIFRDSAIKNIIIDYDLLFPKALSLALESLCIKTFAFQERPTGSLYYLINGVICDFYSYSGELWREYGENKRSILCKKPLTLGSWRNYLFESNPIRIQDSQFHQKVSKKKIEMKIVFLGYFLDDTNLATNTNANHRLFDYVSEVAAVFPQALIVLRMKVLDEKTLQIASSRLGNIPNVFISTDYDTAALSYALCREADAIVSPQSSLAEEALAFGKKVVFVDNLYSVNGLCSSIYPSVFKFMIAKNSVELLSLLQRIISRDKELVLSYRKIKKLLSADEMFKSQAEIPRMITRVFGIT